MRIVSIVGARPQFIKHAALSKELIKSHQCLLIHTGQHYDYNMNKIFFDELGIPEADYNLGVGSGTHAHQTGEMMKGIEDILLRELPNIVIVYGDTNSTLAGALAAVKLHIKVAHVEAGIRMFDKSLPEEINRIVADDCSDYLFCPTQAAVDALVKQGFTQGVYLTGDVMADALNVNKEIAEKSNILDILGLTHDQYIVVTLHRAGNTDSKLTMEHIVNTLTKLHELGETIVFPMHPRTEKMLINYNLLETVKAKAKVVEPQGYLEFLKILNHSKKIITDSGGIQKEAYILKVPCITLMDNTPWPETVNVGWNILAGVDTERIFQIVKNFQPSGLQPNIFGIGASSKIAQILDK
jgi:UDP-N-acetylglucosamine 2-epimerase (non-hydrolysing)